MLLKLNRKINHGHEYIGGCIILSDDMTVFSAHYQGKLLAINKDGAREFKLDLNKPRGVTSIDSSTIAVAADTDISIIDIESRSIMRNIKIGHEIYGLTYKEGSLICCATMKGIISVKLEDGSVSSIIDCQFPLLSYVTTYGDKIYYTGGSGSNKVTCCDAQGIIYWQYEDKNILRDVRGITVDGEGNIFVGGCGTQNVVMLSSDGNNCKEVLSKDDSGLFIPAALYCDTISKRLLVSDLKDIAHLYGIY